MGSALQDLAQHTLQGGFQRVGRVHLVHQAQRQRLPRVELAAGDGQPLRFGIAQPLDEEGPDLRRHDAERGFGEAEHRALAGDRDVGHAGEAEAAAHHRAFEHRHHRERRARERDAELAERRVDLDDGLGVGRQPHARAGHVLDVGAGREVAAGAAEHDDAGAAVTFGRGQRLAKFQHHRHRQRVAHLGPVQRDRQHAAFGVHQQRVEVHAAFLPGSVPSSLQMMPSITSSAPPPMETRRESR